MADAKGIENKYSVVKRNDPSGKHLNCWFFVLDPAHDAHAVKALYAYAQSCMEENPELARDILNRIVYKY